MCASARDRIDLPRDQWTTLTDQEPVTIDFAGGADQTRAVVRPVERGDLDQLAARIDACLRLMPYTDDLDAASQNFRDWAEVNRSLLRAKARVATMRRKR